MKSKSFYFRIPAILIVLLAFSFSAQLRGQCTNIHPDDLAALQELYRATDGDHWTDNTGWNQIMNTTTPAVCDLTTIYGLLFSGDRVSYLRLNSNNLNGIIPTSLGDMAGLRNIDFLSNNLRGTIPRSLGLLANLTSLRFSFNNLTGSMPVEFGNLSMLRIMNLSYNNLSGSIPHSLARLTNLFRLALNVNNLTGIIPRQIGRISGLEEIYLGNNNLRGPMPAELGNLSRLRVLELQANQLTGTIPRSLSRLHLLEILNLGDNMLQGTIPRWLGSLTALQLLHLGHNRFRGSIPPQLGNLSQLYSLSLSQNMLAGSIPLQLGSLLNLNYLYLFDNKLTGHIPGELGNLISLIRIYLHSNDLTGCFHPNLRNLCRVDVRLDDAEFDVPWDDFCKGMGGECLPEPCTDTLRYFPELCILPKEKIVEFGLATADCRVGNYMLTDADGNPLPDTLHAWDGDFCNPVLLTYTCEDGRTCVIQIEISSEFSSQDFVSMTMQEYLRGTTLYSVRGCPGIYTYEDEEQYHSCELTRIKRTWRYTDVCGNTTTGIQFIAIRDFFFCRFVGPFSLPEGIESWIRLDIPENTNLKDIKFEWTVKSRDWKVLGQKGPALLVRPGKSIAKVRVQISFPSGLVVRVRDIFKSYKPKPNNNRLKYERETSGNDVITVYPNPVNNIVNVRMPANEIVQSVQIMDRLGKVVYHHKIQAYDFSIPVDNLVPGVYILRLLNGNTVRSRLFVRQ